ncbi:rhomboid domain-containing protein 3 isoform X2 [Hemicordylus capensis]|uniref:rhomboid domain-containing protein 3 isoform X2 n=1 Tax=Hemicordylus capensis TaxID=884348 RepID=UPI0023029850|nr:rhomboid domain-containing protein 3 isoform X2 [Hemicordylus capensis]
MRVMSCQPGWRSRRRQSSSRAQQAAAPLELAYRLVTYCLCHTGAAHLLLNLLYFPLLGWRQERQQGTLRYLHVSALGAAVSALLYLLLAGLAGTQPKAAVGGYTPVHLAMLGCRQRQRKQPRGSGWICTALSAGLLLGFSQMLLPGSLLLLHLGGLLTCLAYSAGILSPLEVSERRLKKLHKGLVCRTLAGCPFLHFVTSPATGTLPTVDPAAQEERIPPAPELQMRPLSPGGLPTQPLPPYWGGAPAGLGQECSPFHAPGSLPPMHDPGGALDVPFLTLRESLADEELLQAGIQASLQDMSEGEVKLSKSSVSSLRLQQLQKMGFPTERAVVALAATGHVEGAVSLLIGGHVGDKAVVTAESRAAHQSRPPSGGNP